MPSYTQASFTQVAPFLYEGALVMADENTTFAMPTDAHGYANSPLLWAGQPNVIAIARRLVDDDAFLLTLATQRNSNAAQNLLHPSASARLRVPGIATVLTLTSRLQGSIYVFRPADSAADGDGDGDGGGGDGNGQPVLYQPDSWHEATHPLYWSTASAPGAATVIEAELFSGHMARRGARVMRTLRSHASVDEGDFRNFRTYIDLSAARRLGIATTYPLSTEHGVAAQVADDIRCRVRVLARWVSPGGAELRVNGLAISASDEPSHTVADAGEWVWYEARGVVGSVVSLTGSAWVDKLEISMHLE